MLRTAQSLPLEWAFDTGLRPRPFPDEAASLLPGPLAVTRTGLTPASDDELTTQDQPPTRSTSCLWAHGKSSLSSFHLASACEDEDLHGVDQCGGPVGAAADLAQDLPALQDRVGPLAGSALSSVGGVDLALAG